MNSVITHFKKLAIVTVLAFNFCLLNAQNVPELLYYKFDASGTSVTNLASSPVGSNPASITGSGLSISGTGLSGTALSGTGVTSTGGVINTGWSTSLSGSFTIAFWTSNIVSSSTLWYIFGDAGASTFRCFTNGVAGANNWMIRGGGLPDLLISGAATASPNMIHAVYDAVAGQFRAYINGVLNNTVTVSTAVSVSGTGFQIGGYSSNSNLNGLMDEFRIYNRALTQTEITLTYNKTLPFLKGDAGITAILNPPDSFCSGPQNVTVTLKNFNTSPLTSARIDWKVNNVSQGFTTWTGTLASQATTNVSLGSYTFLPATTYTIVAYSSLPNNGQDSLPSNDTMKKSNYVVNSQPNATITFGGPSSICKGDSVSLNANSGTGLTYQWKINAVDVPNANGNTFMAKLAAAYSVTVTNSGNCAKTSAAVTVSVDSMNSPVITAAGPVDFCIGNSVQLNANTATGLTYQWKRDSLIIKSATYFSYTANTSGAYSVIIKKGGCIDSSTAVKVTVNPLPSKKISLTGLTSFCQGDSLIIKADTGTGLTYTWKKDGVIIPSANSSSYTVRNSGSYKVIILNSYNCADSSLPTVVTVKPLPDVTLTPSGPTTFCKGSSVVLNGKSGLGLNFKWKRDGIIIPGANFYYYNSTSSGTYKVIITNSFGCVDTSSEIVVTVNALPVAKITPLGSTTFCNGDSLLLKADTGTNYGYQWRKNGKNIPSANSVNYFVKSAGNYKVVVTSSSSCVDSSVAIPVVVNPSPDAIISSTGSTTLCGGDSVILKANSAKGISYQWNKDAVVINGATDSVYIVKTPGIYTLLTTLGNCSKLSAALAVKTPLANLGKDTTICAQKSIVLNPGNGNGSYLWSTGETTPTITVDSGGVGTGTKTISVKVTLDGCIRYDTIHITFVACTGIQQDEPADGFNIFPNPSHGIFTLEFEKMTGWFEINISDLTGKEVYSRKIYADGSKISNLISLSTAPKGVYLIRISNNQMFSTRKIILE